MLLAGGCGSSDPDAAIDDAQIENNDNIQGYWTYDTESGRGKLEHFMFVDNEDFISNFYCHFGKLRESAKSHLYIDSESSSNLTTSEYLWTVAVFTFQDTDIVIGPENYNGKQMLTSFSLTQPERIESLPDECELRDFELEISHTKAEYSTSNRVLKLVFDYKYRLISEDAAELVMIMNYGRSNDIPSLQKITFDLNSDQSGNIIEGTEFIQISYDELNSEPNLNMSFGIQLSTPDGLVLYPTHFKNTSVEKYD